MFRCRPRNRHRRGRWACRRYRLYLNARAFRLLRQQVCHSEQSTVVLLQKPHSFGPITKTHLTKLAELRRKPLGSLGRLLGGHAQRNEALKHIHELLASHFIQGRLITCSSCWSAHALQPGIKNISCALLCHSPCSAQRRGSDGVRVCRVALVRHSVRQHRRRLRLVFASFCALGLCIRLIAVACNALQEKCFLASEFQAPDSVGCLRGPQLSTVARPLLHETIVSFLGHGQRL
mmetsp:Transcript_5072/g.14073  ORF Transcript_5072/g.14073 Transcript_5072/m.14073 type:complete len:234 (+) Transcript_5072:399-1100(+)